MSKRPTIVLLPGLLCDASTWDAQRKALKPHADVRIGDFTQLDSIEGMARSALALADGPLVAVGHSMGARVAMEMVRLAPERIEKLVLIDTGIDPRREGEEEKRQELVDLAFAEGMGALADKWLPPMVHLEGSGTRRCLLRSRPWSCGRRPSSTSARSGRSSIARMPGPALHRSPVRPWSWSGGRIAGARWPSIEEIAALIPNAELVVIEDSGHMSPVEQPEQVSQALLRLLGFENKNDDADGVATGKEKPMGDETAPDRIPDTPLFDRKRSLRGYRINKMAMGLGDPANREAFRKDESAYLDRFGLTPEEKQAVMTRNWREMVRLGGNLFFILKISAVDPVRITEIGAHQAGMDHADFLRDRLGKK